MKTFRKRILPKVWLSAIAIGVLFLGFAGATVKASGNQTNGYFSLTSVGEYLYETFTGSAMVFSFQFQQAAYSVNEPSNTTPAPGQPTITFVNVVVTRSGTDDQNPTTVQISTGDGSATGGAACGAGVDYINQNVTLTFQANDVQQTFSIPVCSDGVFEGANENFNVILSNPGNDAVVGSPSNTVVTINEFDTAAPGTFGFAPIGGANPQRVDVAEETPGTVVLSVVRSAGSAGTVTVPFTITNGAAVGGAACNGTGSVDFVLPASSTLTFVDGDTLEQITIQICDDPVFENNETFTVTLGTPSSGSLGAAVDNSRTVRILDGEGPQVGILSFGAATFSANEGVGPAGGANVASGGTTTIRIPVIRSGGTDGAVSATVTFTNLGATGGANCTAAAQTADYDNSPNPVVNFVSGGGAATQTAFVDIVICNNDLNPEPVQEQFAITLNPTPTGSGPTPGLGANPTATITIFDDATGTIQFNPTSYTPTEGNSASATGTTIVPLTVTRNVSELTATTQVVVNYTFGPGNGTGTSAAVGGAACGTSVGGQAVDFINTGGTLTFDPNVTQQILNVTICADTVFELGEDFSVILSQGSANSVIVFPNPVVSAGGVQSAAPAPNPSRALVTIGNDDTAQAGQISLADAAFSPISTLTVNESAGGTVPIQLVRSFADEAATVTVTISNGVGINGAQGGTACTANVDFINPLLSTAGATSGSTTVTFAAGQTTVTAPFSITICNDAVFENNESFTVSLSNATSVSGNASVSPTAGTLTITIVDNDAQPGSLSLSAPVLINESGGQGFPVGAAVTSRLVPITVTRPAGQTNGQVTATLTLGSGTAIGGAACGDAVTDFVNPGPQTVTIADNATSTTVNVEICNNDINDAANDATLQENFTATLSNPTGGATLGAAATQTFTIQDDARGTFQIVAANNPATINETGTPGTGTPRQITVTRIGGSTGTANINYAFGGTAVGATGDCTLGNGLDYTFLPGNNTLTFAPGVTSATFTINVCNDLLFEGATGETLTVTLTSTNELIGTADPFTSQTFTFNIIDDETAPTFAIAVPQGTAANEGTAGQTTPFVFTVTPSVATQSGAAGTTVNFSTGGGTATGGTACTAGVDYITNTGSINFANNSTASQQITVNVCGDTIVEDNETFVLTLSGTNVAAGTTATATIINDDGVNGTVTVADIRVVEDGTVPGSNFANPAPATSNQTITIALANPTVNAASVQVSTANGTAIGGAACGTTVNGQPVDYVTVTNGTANFAANSGTASLNVTICNDTRKEANETFFVNLSGGNNATINDSQAVVIIVDNDRNFRADFDRDRRTDVSLFRPSNGFFYVLQSINGLFVADQLGQNGDIPTPGDFDNDGATDLAFYRPSTASFIFRRSIDNAIVTVPFGLATDIPVQGDYNGDGATDVAVFRPSNGTFYFSTTLTNASQNFTAIQFGQAGDIPVPADYDGDFDTDVAIFRNGTFFVLSNTGSAIGTQFGQAGDRPIVGDFDGDGRADLTVFRPSGTPNVTGGVFFTLQSLTNTPAGVAFGSATDIPAVGDYDGDGTDDVAIFRPTPSAGFGPSFFFLRSATGSTVNVVPGSNGATRFGNANFDRVEFGIAGDIPLPARYQPAVQQ